MICISLVEDHDAFRDSLALLLDREPDLKVVERAGSLAKARQRDLHSTDVAVVDLFLPDGNGIELLRELRQQGTPRMLVLPISLDPQKHDEARQAGADEVLTKDSGIDEVVEAIRSLANL